MSGAQDLMKKPVDAGSEVCFSKPVASETHFIAALDNEPKMRAVLGLFTSCLAQNKTPVPPLKELASAWGAGSA